MEPDVYVCGCVWCVCIQLSLRTEFTFIIFCMPANTLANETVDQMV